MLGETSALEIVTRALRALPATDQETPLQADAFLFAQDNALTRFANNTIHQNVAESDARVVVRIARGRRLGLATTNDTSDAGLARARDAALSAARLSPEKPDFPGLPAPRPIPAVTGFDDATAAYSPAQRAAAVGALCTQAHARDLIAAGAFETGAHETAYASTQGTRAYHVATRADFQTVVMSADSSGWAHALDWRVGQLDTAALGTEALTTAERGRAPRALDAGVYPVILGPDAVQNLISMLTFPGAGALATQEGRSWMSGRAGQRLLSPLVSIWDDGTDPAGCPNAFDGEGQPKMRVELVTDGVVGTPVYDSATAAREPGRVSTGHAMPPLDPLYSTFGPLPENLFMRPGTESVDELIARTPRGLYITRFWYTRTVHPRDAIVTGLTRDGVFWIEDGALAYPVHNLRFTQGFFTALAAVSGLSRTVRTGGAGFGRIAVTAPALKLDEFNFTGTAPRA